MDFILNWPIEYDRMLNILSSIVGLMGFVFGIWRYFRERRAKVVLGERERQLAETLSRLKAMKRLAGELDRHHAMV